MKRPLILAVALCAIAASCAKRVAEEPIRYTSVVLSYGKPESGPLTKAESSLGDTLSLLASQALPSLELRLTHQRFGLSYTCHVGDTLSLPVGAYSVTGSNSVSQMAYNTAGLGLKSFYTEYPVVAVNAEISVQEGVSGYSIPVSWRSAVFALRESESLGADLFMLGSTYKANGYLRGYGYKVLFFSGDTEQGCNNFIVNPLEELTLLPRTYQLTSRENLATKNGWSYITSGRWYLFRPADVPIVDGGLNCVLPSLSEGTL